MQHVPGRLICIAERIGSHHRPLDPAVALPHVDTQVIGSLFVVGMWRQQAAQQLQQSGELAAISKSWQQRLAQEQIHSSIEGQLLSF